MITAQFIEDYLKKSTDLFQDLQESKEQLPAFLAFIEEQKRSLENCDAYTDFFEGENAFYHERYETALKHYLQAREVPRFQFFCFRASAYLSATRGDPDKAVIFAKKALQLYPNDILSQKIIEESGNHPSLFPKKDIPAPSPHEESDSIEGNAQEKNNEATMYTDASIFSPTTPKEGLTQRLYEFNTTEETAEEEKEPVQQRSIDNFICQPSAPNSSPPAIEQSVLAFQKKLSDTLKHYLAQWETRQHAQPNGLYILHGWNETSFAHQLPLTERARQTSGGYFFQWNGKGIALNPGKHFLDHFHRQQLHIRDIDYVIVTRDHPDAYAEIKEIYDLNAQLNKVSGETRVIEYFLNQNAYQELSKTLKPNFKQERHTVHCLELYADSPDVEKIELSPGIVLNYFPITTRESQFPSSMGICFDFERTQQKIRIGYLSAAPWSPLLADRLGKCDLLITGFGDTSPNDYSKIKYNEDCLGYYGNSSLLEEVSPKLLICCEFSGREGDIRLESVKKLKQEYGSLPGVVLPGETELFINLASFQIRCSISKSLVDPHQVHISKTTDAFGKLLYLSPGCIG